MNADFFTNKKARFLLLVSLFLVLFFWKTEMFLKIVNDIFSVLSPFLLAGAIAFVINVPMSWIEKKLFYFHVQKKRLSMGAARGMSLILSIFFFALLIAFAILVIVPQIQNTVSTLAVKVEIFAPQAQEYVISLFNNNPEITEFVDSINIEQMKQSLIDFLRAGILSFFDSTLTVASTAISLIAKIFIAIVFAMYILLQKETLTRQIKRVLFAYCSKEKALRIVYIFSLIQKAFTRFISGQSIEAVILGTLIVVILSLFSIPFSLLIGVVVGFSSFVPILGAFFGAGICSFLLLVEDPIQAVYFLIIFLIVQQVEGNFIYPKVVGDSIGLPAMWVLAAVSIGGTLMGVTGILLCIPLASVAYCLLRDDVNSRL